MFEVKLPTGEIGWPVPGFPGYFATLSGKIWSNRRRGPGNGFKTDYVEISGSVDKDGYRKLILCVAGKRHYKRVHIVILETFVGPCPAGREGRHRNGKCQDNRLTNLSWATHVENIADKRKHGTHLVGEQVGTSKYTAMHARRVKRMLAAGLLTRSQIATKAGVPRHFVSNIKNGAWAHVEI